MTVTANTTRNDYTAGSAQSEYDYTFQLNEAADVDVYLDGVKQTLNTHYVVQNVGNASGGTIVFTLEDENGDPIDPTEGAIINIVMAMDLDRDTNYQPSGAFLAADVNNDFDRLWLATNQQQTAVNRALRLKDTDVTTSSMELPLKDDRKGKLLAFNATTGDPEATTNNQSNWDTAYNNMITSASFSGSTLTLGQQDGGTITASHTPYLPIAGGTLTGDLRFNDNDELKFGDSNDLRIYHNGISSIIQDVGTGDLALLGTNLAFANGSGTSYYAAGTEGGAFTLYYNGSEKLATTSGGISVTGTITATGYNDSNWNTAYNDKINSASFDTSNGVLTLTQQDGGTVTVDLDGRYSTDTGIALGDNQKATFGDDNDLEIYHDGSNSYVKDTGTGYLILGNSDAGTIIKNGSGQNLLTTTASEIRLGHEGNTKLATKSTGIDVTGTVTADGLTVDGADSILLTATSGASVSWDSSSSTDLKTTAILEGQANANLKLSTDSSRNNYLWSNYVNTDLIFGKRSYVSGANRNTNALKIASNGDISFYEDTGTTPKFFWDASAERLGIGTTNPSTALEVSGSAKITGNGQSLTVDQVSGSGGAGVILKSTGTNLPFVRWTDGTTNIAGMRADDSGKFYIQTNGFNNRLTIDSSGNVGIGTSSPAYELDVNGTIAADNAIFGTTSDAQTIVYVTSSTTGESEIRLGDTDTDAGSIAYNNSDNSMQFRANAAERLRIDSSGNVGIGGAPAAVTHGPHLDLVGNRGTLTVGTGYFEDNGTTNFIGGARSLAFGAVGSGERMRIDSSGKVGIGTSSPSASLHTVGANATATNLATSATNAKVRIQNNSVSSLSSYQGYTGNSWYTQVANGNGTTAYDLSLNPYGGNVGIGTTSPTHELTVGNANAETTIGVAGNRSQFGYKSDLAVVQGGSGKGIQFNVNNNTFGSGEAVRIDSSGNVGIGTTSPAANLHVDASAPEFRLSQSGTAKVRLRTTGDNYINTGQNLGIGTTSPSQLLHVNGTARATTVLSGDGTASAPAYAFSNDTNTGIFRPFPDTLAFSEGGVERMRINSSGNVGIGTTSPTFPLHVNGGAKFGNFQCSSGSIITQAGYYAVAGVYIRNWSSTSTSYSTMIDFAKANGTSVGTIKSNNTSTQYNTSSDVRLKENIRDAEDAGAKIDAIQIRQFDWKNGGEHQDYGVIAQELKEVAPEAVSEGNDEEEMWGVDYSKLVPTLIKEIQSLRNRVAELEKN